MRKTSIIFLCLLLTICANGQVNYNSLQKEIDSLLTAGHENPFNGIVLLAQDQTAIYERVMGYSDIDSKQSLNRNSLFVIGSISKQITAALVLREFERGTIALHTPIRAYLPELKQEWANQVTVHHLLTHTHGISSLNQPLEFPVGTQFAYSQIGYGLLSDILEHVCNDSFANLSANLFEQCEMKNTFHPSLLNEQTCLASGYEESDGQLLKTKDKIEYVAAGGFISTADDLLRWNNCLFEGSLLQASSLELMQTQWDGAIRNHPVFGTTHYGYGITVEHSAGILQLGQTGLVPGFVSMNFYFPETKISVIVLENMAYNLHNLKETFYFHTKILDLIRR